MARRLLKELCRGSCPSRYISIFSNESDENNYEH
jgi:hypothetical protein